MVSVIIPTYNRADLVGRAIRSVLGQTYHDWELIIVDDGSTDDTKKIVGELSKGNEKVKYFYKENGGQGSARNLGIKHSRGGHIAFLDSDDEWAPDKLKKQVDYLEKDPAADFCYTADKIISLKDKKTYVKGYHLDQKALSFAKLAGIGIGVPSSHLYRRSSFERIGFFDESRILIGLEDNEWSVRGFMLRGIYLDEPLTLYYTHPGQITKDKVRRQLAGLEFILKKHRKLFLKHKRALIFRLLQLGYLRIKNILPDALRRLLHRISIKLISHT